MKKDKISAKQKLSFTLEVCFPNCFSCTQPGLTAGLRYIRIWDIFRFGRRGSCRSVVWMHLAGWLLWLWQLEPLFIGIHWCGCRPSRLGSCANTHLGILQKFWFQKHLFGEIFGICSLQLLQLKSSSCYCAFISIKGRKKHQICSLPQVNASMEVCNNNPTYIPYANHITALLK